MDEAFKRRFETELRHLRSHARAFAADGRYAGVAARLGLAGDAELHDPFIDWLLQGYAFLAARVQTALDAEFPQFTRALLSVAAPHLAAPTPSMLIAEFTPDPRRGGGSGAAEIERGRRLFLAAEPPGATGADSVRRLTYTTGRALRLTPLEIREARYLPDAAAVAAAGGREPAEAGLLVELALPERLPGAIGDHGADALDIFLRGADGDDARLFAALALSGTKAEALWPLGSGASPLTLAPLGLDEAEGEDRLLPHDGRSFEGFRLLQEFFALPERFHFVRVGGLAAAAAGRGARAMSLLFRLPRRDDRLIGRVGRDDLRLNCVPAVNLFRFRADEIAVTPRRSELHVLPDRGDPTGYEAHSVRSVTGRTQGGAEQAFRPFFAVEGLGAARREGGRFYALRRERRATPLLPEARDQSLDEYRGSELHIALVDDAARPFDPELRSLSVELLCTNRHLPLHARGASERGGAPLGTDRDDGAAIRVVAGPSAPRDGLPEGRALWDAVSHLSFNHLALTDGGGTDGRNGGARAAASLRRVARIHAREGDLRAERLLDALLSVETAPAARRIAVESPGGAAAPIAFVRGIDICIRFDERVELSTTFAAVLDRFLAGHAGANAFTRLIVEDRSGAVRLAFPARAGARPLL